VHEVGAAGALFCRARSKPFRSSVCLTAPEYRARIQCGIDCTFFQSPPGEPYSVTHDTACWTRGCQPRTWCTRITIRKTRAFGCRTWGSTGLWYGRWNGAGNDTPLRRSFFSGHRFQRSPRRNRDKGGSWTNILGWLFIPVSVCRSCLEGALNGKLGRH
jgi:hypothetical protein